MHEEPGSPIDENIKCLSEGDEASAWAERWLSPERLAPYLASCGGGIEKALDLYEWNAALAQVVMREICRFEVALRNAYDRVMCKRWDSGSISPTAPARPRYGGRASVACGRRGREGRSSSTC